MGMWDPKTSENTQTHMCTALYKNCTLFFLHRCKNVTEADFSPWLHLLVCLACGQCFWATKKVREWLHAVLGPRKRSCPIKGGVDGRDSFSLRGASGSAVNYINGYILSLRGVLFQVVIACWKAGGRRGDRSRKKILRWEETHFLVF